MLTKEVCGKAAWYGEGIDIIIKVDMKEGWTINRILIVISILDLNDHKNTEIEEKQLIYCAACLQVPAL